MKRRSPQEKKALSRTRDRRNDYGENDKSSRKNIPRSKAIQRRKYRRKLRYAPGAAPDLELNEPAAATRVRKGGWRKSPDIPLGELIERQRARRSRKNRN